MKNKTPTYIAMLRGINVSGYKSVRMEDLRKLFTKLGYADIRTYSRVEM